MCSREDDPTFVAERMTDHEIRTYKPLGECDLCGEAFFPKDERAEIVHKALSRRPDIKNNMIVHAQCFLNHSEEFDLA